MGDSLGMVMYGMESTVGVTLDMMIAHGKAVMRGSSHALVVVDMPFGSYEESPQVAFRNAARVMQETGCTAVKMEGGQRLAETVRYLTERGIPVMGHIGLTPQAVNVTGGFRRARGRTEAEWPAIEADAKAIAEAGAFAIVLEGMAEPLAAKITRQIAVPTIGIGASPDCDGQILVMEDMLGLNPNPPKFVRQYASLGPDIERAVKAYAADVRARAFPGKEKRLHDEEGGIAPSPQSPPPCVEVDARSEASTSGGGRCWAPQHRPPPEKIASLRCAIFRPPHKGGGNG